MSISLRAAGIADRALDVLFHLAQRVGQPALDRLQDALALDVLVLALVEVGRAAVVLLVELAVHVHGLARRLLVAGQQRADHHHGGAEADALGDVAVLADAAVGDDGLGRHAGAPLQRRQLPAAGAEAGLHARDADLAGADADLGGVGAPVLQVDDRLGRGHVAGDDERRRAACSFRWAIMFFTVSAWPCAMSMVMYSGTRPSARQLVHRVVVGLLDAQRDRGVDAPAPSSRARTSGCPGRSGASRRSSRFAPATGRSFRPPRSSCWPAPPGCGRCGRPAPRRRRIRNGSPRGICAAAAGLCRNRRFPYQAPEGSL